MPLSRLMALGGPLEMVYYTDLAGRSLFKADPGENKNRRVFPVMYC